MAKNDSTTERLSRKEAAKRAAETRRLRKAIVPGMYVGGSTNPGTTDEAATDISVEDAVKDAPEADVTVAETAVPEQRGADSDS